MYHQVKPVELTALQRLLAAAEPRDPVPMRRAARLTARVTIALVNGRNRRRGPWRPLPTGLSWQEEMGDSGGGGVG